MSKYVHRVTEIDTKNKTGICSNCGKVNLKKRKNSGGYTYWQCRKATNIQNKKSRNLQRNPHRKFVGEVCERCGFIPEHKCQLDVHHKDNDHNNNAEDNLRTLCANCHRLFSCVPNFKEPL